MQENVSNSDKLIVLHLNNYSFSKLIKQTKFAKSPEEIMSAMYESTRAVLKYCVGSQIAYIQGDGITILLQDDLESENRSTETYAKAACLASVAFCNHLNKNWVTYNQAVLQYFNLDEGFTNVTFDYHVSRLPSIEINNTFFHHQQSALENSINSIAWYGLSKKYSINVVEKMLEGLSLNDRQNIIYQELKVDINTYPTKHRRGVCFLKNYTNSSHWIIDEDIPLFNQNLDYINKFLA